MSKKVVCLGTATLDVFLSGQVLTPVDQAGEHYISLNLGDKLYLNEATFATGGNASNAAVTFARAGFESVFVGALGDDASAQTIQQAWQEAGVLAQVAVLSGARTDYSVVLLAPDGRRTILRVKGQLEGGLNLATCQSALNGADWLYLSGLGDLSLSAQIIRYAKESHLGLTFNPGTLDLKSPQKLRPLLAGLDILVVNKQEAEIIFGQNSLANLAKAASQVVQTAIITDGPNGLVAANDGVLYEAGLYSNDPIVDRTGAGDALASGFTAAWLKEGSIEAGLTYGSANATSVVAQIGSTAGIIYPQALRPLKIKRHSF